MRNNAFSLVGVLAWQRLLFTGKSEKQLGSFWVDFPGIWGFILPEYILFNCPGHHFLSRVLIMGGLYILGAVLYGCRLT